MPLELLSSAWKPIYCNFLTFQKKLLSFDTVDTSSAGIIYSKGNPNKNSSSKNVTLSSPEGEGGRGDSYAAT